jgi:hypothetical protein
MHGWWDRIYIFAIFILRAIDFSFSISTGLRKQMILIMKESSIFLTKATNKEAK